MTTETQAVTEQPVSEHHASEAPGVLDFNGQMVVLTWIAFAIAATLLGKFLWKPILNFVEARETEIKDALEDAQKARQAAATADAEAAKTRETAEREARAYAEEQAATTRQHIAKLEEEIKEGRRMKKYMNPEIEVVEVNTSDIITTSPGTETPWYEENDGIWSLEVNP